jgi:hypothetical protein
MMWNHIHQEEARATNHDADAMELAGVAPPCAACGKREPEPGSELCENCQSE